jgi:hypothetical protein
MHLLKSFSLLQLLVETLAPPGSSKPIQAARLCADGFRRDCGLWSVRHGTNSFMVGLRGQIVALSSGSVSSSSSSSLLSDGNDGNGVHYDALGLLERMVHFDPSMRCTMLEVINHPLFHCFNVDNNTHGAQDVNFMHYLKSPDSLSML